MKQVKTNLCDTEGAESDRTEGDAPCNVDHLLDMKHTDDDEEGKLQTCRDDGTQRHIVSVEQLHWRVSHLTPM